MSSSAIWNRKLLEGGFVTYHSIEQDRGIVYGDYYFIEALMKLAGRDFFP